MENRKRVTEEDLLHTEAMIAASYNQLKQSVIEVPAKVYREVNHAVHEHPVASAATAVVAGVVVFKIIEKMTSRPSGQQTKNTQPPRQNTSRQDLMHDVLLMMIPMVTPYITTYLQKYIGSLETRERE